MKNRFALHPNEEHSLREFQAVFPARPIRGNGEPMSDEDFAYLASISRAKAAQLAERREVERLTGCVYVGDRLVPRKAVAR